MVELIHFNPNDRLYCVEIREHGHITKHAGYTDNFKRAQDEAGRASQAFNCVVTIAQWKPRGGDDHWSPPEIRGYWGSPHVKDAQTRWEPLIGASR